MWIKIGSSQLAAPPELWAKYSHPGENPLCINKFEEFSVHRLWMLMWVAGCVRSFVRVALRTRAYAAKSEFRCQASEKGVTVVP